LLVEGNRRYVESTLQFSTFFKWFLQFNSSHTLSAQWFYLEESLRRIASVRPGPVPIIAMSGFSSSVQFWPRLSRRIAADNDRDDVDIDDEGPDDLEGAEDQDQTIEFGELSADAPSEVDDLLALALEFLVDQEIEPSAEPPPVVPQAPSSSSSSSSMPMPMPVPPPPSPTPKASSQNLNRKKPTTHAELTVQLTCGSIRYYPNNGNFEATCTKHGGRCTLTRSNHGTRQKDGTYKGGRPLGLLLLWLHQCIREPDSVPNKTAHTKKELIKDLSSPQFRSQRRKLRTLLEAKTSTGVNMLEWERFLLPDEDPDPEPETVP